MADMKITSGYGVNPPLEWAPTQKSSFDPIDNLKKIQQRKAQQSYYQDSIASADPQPPTKFASIDTIDTLEITKKSKEAPKEAAESTGFFSWIFSLFRGTTKSNNTETGSEDKSEGTSSPIPKLTPPENNANMEKIIKYIEKMNRDLERIQQAAKEESEFETTNDDFERNFLKMLIARVHENTRIRDEQTLANKDNVSIRQNEAREAQHKTFEIQNEVNDKMLKSKRLGWIQFGSDVTLFAVAGIGGALFLTSSLATAGVLPAALAAITFASSTAYLTTVLGYAGAVAGVARATSTYLKADLDHKGRQQTGEIASLKHTKDKCQMDLKKSMEEIKESMDSVATVHEYLMPIHKRRSSTIQNIFN